MSWRVSGAGVASVCTVHATEREREEEEEEERGV
jgi:hypothetical protein